MIIIIKIIANFVFFGLMIKNKKKRNKIVFYLKFDQSFKNYKIITTLNKLLLLLKLIIAINITIILYNKLIGRFVVFSLHSCCFLYEQRFTDYLKYVKIIIFILSSVSSLTQTTLRNKKLKLLPIKFNRH